MSMAATDATVQRVQRHAHLRWIGAPLLLSGLGLLCYALFGVFVGGSGMTLGLSALGTGMALASFGANHDTAMALAFQLQGSGDLSLPTGIRDELEEELERSRDAVIGLRASPRVAMVLPLVAVLVQAWVAFRLFGGGG